MARKICMRIACSFVGNRAVKGLMRSKQLVYLDELRKMQWNSLEENIRQQKELLHKVVCYAVSKVPYYRDLGFTEDDFRKETIFEDIKKFPILTKDIIRTEGGRMCSDVDDWKYNTTSGGTTGEPVRFIHTGTFFDYDQAGKLLYDEWCGRMLGESQIRLWGSERDIISGKRDWKNKIYRWCRNEIFLNTFAMSDEQIEKYIQKINKVKPKMILAYVQSAREVAMYAKRHNIKVYSPNAVMTSAGTLDSDTHHLLSEVFNCPVHNRYGSREMGDMACSCGENKELHVNVRSTYIEVVDDKFCALPDGESGNLIVTSLTEYGMPLIRYQIGDVGALANNSKCKCGRGLPMLKCINGRIVDVFMTEDGKKVDGEYFTHLFYSENSIKQFQIVQDKINHIIVKLVPYNQVSNEVYERLSRNIRMVMGESVEIEYEITERIQASRSGKLSYTISLI